MWKKVKTGVYRHKLYNVTIRYDKALYPVMYWVASNLRGYTFDSLAAAKAASSKAALDERMLEEAMAHHNGVFSLLVNH